MRKIVIIPFAILIVFALCTLFIASGRRIAGLALMSFAAPALAQDAGTAKAVFVVHCYDEGKTALESMPGVKRVDKAFRHLREINTVYYDPTVITIPDMEKALKKAGTYTETVGK